MSQLLRFILRLMPARVVRGIGMVQFRYPAMRRLVGWATSRALTGEVTVQRGPARGLKLDLAGSHPGYAAGTTEPYLQDAFVKHIHPGGVVYDVGANVGFYTLLAARLVGDTGAVVAFEPDPSNAAILRANVERNGFVNVTVMQMGVSDEAGTRNFDASGDTAARLSNEGTDTIEVTSLDAFEGRPPTFVKLDIEGEEIRALPGARRTLNEHRPVVICETHGPTCRDVVESELRGAGYRVAQLEDEDTNNRPHLLGLAT